PLQKDIYLRINLSFPSHKTPMELTGKVVWVKEEKSRFITGVKFVDFDDETYRKIIQDYISEKSVNS
ncbi:MAG: PilZ domain-containing protein, partial [bacterium]|nr:PilZ domain-containing protein [bacterium]